MFNRYLKQPFGGYAFYDQVAFGGWKPPSNQLVSASLGLVISACVAMRFALDAPKSGDLAAVLTASKHVLTAATLVASSFKRV